MAVWYGYDEWNPVYHNYLRSYQSARLFQAVGGYIFNSNKEFEKPAGVVPVTLEYGCPSPCLPSAYTPDNKKITELFISGTEPSTVSDRYDKLESVTNLKASANGSKVTLTWTAIKTPRALDKEALKEYYKPIFRTGALDSYVNGILGENQSTFGQLGYNVYSQDSDGLNLLGFTTDTTYTISNQGGNKTYVVKATYSNFTANMSDGKSVSIQLGKLTSPKETFIKQLYNNCLGRTATNDEINDMSSYTSAATIAYNICNSTEAIDRYSSADQAIPTWYKGIIGRNIKDDELTNINNIYTTNNRQKALKEVINSSDFKSYCATNNLVYTEI